MNDYIKRYMGVILAVCIAVLLPACAQNKASSSSNVKKPNASVASSRLSSSGSSSSPASSAVTSAVSSESNSSKGTATTQHTGGKSGGTTGKSTGKATGGGGTGRTAGNGGATTGRGVTGGTGGGGGYTPTPAPTGFATQYYGANYGCADASQYAFVLSKAQNIESTSDYKETYSDNKVHASEFEEIYGYAYSDEMNEVMSLGAACDNGSHGKSSTGSAYNYFTGKNAVCADYAKAYEACLHAHGYDARLCWSSSHMWVKVSVHGCTVILGSNGTTKVGEGYNYG